MSNLKFKAEGIKNGTIAWVGGEYQVTNGTFSAPEEEAGELLRRGFEPVREGGVRGQATPATQEGS